MNKTVVYRNLREAREDLDHPVVTIGNFDGVHIGHQAIFERARRRADDSGVRAVALTFVPHPVRHFQPDTDEFRISTDDQKFRLIVEHGLDAAVALTFDESIANLEPEAFVERIVDDGLNASHVVVGSNFRFGKRRAGSTDDLVEWCAQRDIGSDICDEIEYDGEVVSSTRIRNLLQRGEVEAAAELLSRPHRVAGTVIHGDKRGRDLGYPTANIEPENLLPANGIYATRLHSDTFESPLTAASSIGVRPTFDGRERRLEAYVLDRDDLDLYDRQVEVEFHAFIRPEATFDSADELVAQMDEDVERIRERLGGN